MKYLYPVNDEKELERLRESTKKMPPLSEKLPGSGCHCGGQLRQCDRGF